MVCFLMSSEFVWLFFWRNFNKRKIFFLEKFFEEKNHSSNFLESFGQNSFFDDLTLTCSQENFFHKFLEFLWRFQNCYVEKIKEREVWEKNNLWNFCFFALLNFASESEFTRKRFQYKIQKKSQSPPKPRIFFLKFFLWKNVLFSKESCGRWKVKEKA